MMSIKGLTQTQEDRQYLLKAFAERARSDDPKGRSNPASAVGAVIAGPHGVIATSANIVPPRLADSAFKQNSNPADEDRYFFIEHAERAAIFKALLGNNNLHGTTIYCTRFPCADCARAIIWAGITRAVLSAGLSKERLWLQSQRAALRMMREAGITVRVVSQVHSAYADQDTALLTL